MRLFLIPVVLVAILCLPVMGFSYLSDDFDFLTNALTYRLDDLLPDPSDPFYRPISRGIYYIFLDLAGPHGPLLGHLLNLAFLCGIVFLLSSFTARLAGRRAGLLAGFLYVALGAVPVLVGWICCVQDLLAMLFVLGALHFRFSGKPAAALVATAAGLLCKETTLAVIPVLALFDWILRRDSRRLRRDLLSYGALVLVWAMVHPGVRILVARGLRSGATGYVGLEHPERWPVHFGRYLLTLLNLPAYKSLPAWLARGFLLLLVALGAVALGLRSAKEEQEPAHSRPIPLRRVVLLGGLLALGPLLLTSTLLRSWAPYYSVYPALGLCLIAGAALGRVPLRIQASVLVLYYGLGLWVRGATDEPRTPTEPNLSYCSQALRQVERGFRRLYPSIPAGTQFLLSVQTHGPGGVYAHMYFFQVLRVWYRDRGIHAIRPEARKPGSGRDLLCVITRDRDVIDINPVTLEARSASGTDPAYHACETAVRGYATGLAGSGETDAAVSVLLRMPEVNRGLLSVHRRIAAMFLLAEGRISEADTILASAPALPRGVALADLRAVLAEQPPGRLFDDPALRAFEISPDDSAAARDLMRWFSQMKYVEPAIRFAQRLEKLRPGDTEAVRTTHEMTAILEERRRAPPGPDRID